VGNKSSGSMWELVGWLALGTSHMTLLWAWQSVSLCCRPLILSKGEKSCKRRGLLVALKPSLSCEHLLVE
jgi:hypothetical protein